MRAFGRRAAAVDAPVLLVGESGTGKGVLARAIHEASARTRAAFVSVNCAAIPEALFESEFFGHVRGAFTGAQYAHKGLFEQAHGGTLFLDEAGDLPLVMQAKLLTVIEDRAVRRVGGERVTPFDARIISATATDLEHAIANKTFRRDLFHRLRVLYYHIPPLRLRHGDALLLAEQFLATYAHKYQLGYVELSANARAFIDTWPWHGNVRELAHAIESAVVACEDGVIESMASFDYTNVSDRPGSFQRVRYSFAGTRSDELQLIHQVIERCKGNKTRAAFELGMSRNTLLNKLRAAETAQ
jgi:transcriptional regulator with PAS, ATPase and Fis domain